MSNLDLNIENYTIDDLVSFFRLSSIFTESDVLKKESEIRTILLSSGHIAPHFKRDLIIFLEEGKKRIIENRITKTTPSVIYKNPTTIPDNFPLPNVKVPSRADNVIIQNDSNFINPHDVKRITRTLNIDTIFRENYDTTKSTDFLLTLNEPLKNVISLKLASLEMPNMWYSFSSLEKTNTFKISCFNIPNGNPDQTYTITIPDGNYLASTFEDIMNSILLNIGGGLQYIRFDISPYSTKSTFRAATLDDQATAGSLYPYVVNTNFYFTLNFEVPTIQMSKTAGWMLGYRKLIYEANYETTNTNLGEPDPQTYRNNIQSESSFGSNETQYIFLELDDFQRNCVTDKVISTNKYYLGNNILARITLTTGKNTIIIDNGVDNMFKKRDYFGPAKIEKFRIRVMDRYGTILNLNENDFSFVLEVEQIYSY